MYLTQRSTSNLELFVKYSRGGNKKMTRSALVDFASLAHLHPDNYRVLRFIEKVAPMLLGVGLVVSGGVALVGITLQALPVLGLSAGGTAAATLFVALLVAAACTYHVRKKIVQEQKRLPDMPAAPKDSDAEVKGIYANIMHAEWQSRVLYPTLNVLAAYALLIASVRAGFVLVPTLTVLGMSQTLSVLLASSLLVLSNVVFRVLATMAVRGRRETYRKCHVAFSRALLRYNRLSSSSYNAVPASRLPVAQDPTLRQTATEMGDLAVAPVPVVVKGQPGKGVDAPASGSDGAVGQNNDNPPDTATPPELTNTQTTSKKQAPSVSSGTVPSTPITSQNAAQSVPSSTISSTPVTPQDAVQAVPSSTVPSTPITSQNAAQSVTVSTSKENQGYGDSGDTPASAVSKGNQANTNAQHDMSTSSAGVRQKATETGESSINSRSSTPVSDWERNKQEGQQTASTEGTPSFLRVVDTAVKGSGSRKLSPSLYADRLAGANKEASNQEPQSPVISGTVTLLPNMTQDGGGSSEQPKVPQKKSKKKKPKGINNPPSASDNNGIFSFFGLSGKGTGGNNAKRR